MNGTEAAFSYTLKTPAGNLVTVRGDDYDEFFNNLHALANDPEIVGVLGQLQSSVGAHSDAGSVDQSPARRQSNPPRGNATNPDDGPTDSDNACKHGERVLKSGEKNGRAWSGYFCPVSDKMCKPVWNK